MLINAWFLIFLLKELELEVALSGPKHQMYARVIDCAEKNDGGNRIYHNHCQGHVKDLDELYLWC